MKTRSTKITATLEEYYQLNETIKQLEKQKTLLKSEALQYMQEHGTSSLDAMGFNATISPQTRTSLDARRLREYLGDKLENFSRVTKFNVFKVVRS
jgi:predicted phage-related endonuclease